MNELRKVNELDFALSYPTDMAHFLSESWQARAKELCNRHATAELSTDRKAIGELAIKLLKEAVQ